MLELEIIEPPLDFHSERDPVPCQSSVFISHPFSAIPYRSVTRNSTIELPLSNDG